MKLVKVDKPFGNIRLQKWGRRKAYIVNTERTKHNETFNEWFERKVEYMENNPNYKDVKAMVLYDVITYPDQGALYIRYGLIK